MQFVVNEPEDGCVDSLLDDKHRSDLFSTIALEKDLPGRFSRLLQLPVSRDDGLQFTAAESVSGG